jgi:hypothetical protein
MIGLSAGLAAQRRIAGYEYDDYANVDVGQCEAIARAVAPGAESELCLLAQERDERIVSRHWRQIEALAAELRLHRQLDAGQIAAVIERSAPQRLVYGFERRSGRTVATTTPDPRRATAIVAHRTDGFIR